MKPTNKSISQKGETNIYYVAVGILIAIAAYAAVRYYQDRNNDIVIHVPKVEVR